jgi:DNA ligase-associated metallophosphoesterase
MRAIAGSISTEWARERWVLLPQRALWWARRRTLIVADMHLGKAAAFRAAGVPVPEVVGADLAKLGALIDATGAERVVVVGDLLHAASGRTSAVVEAVSAWRRERAGLQLLLVLGNHDVRSGEPPREWGVGVHAPPLAMAEDGGIAFIHDPETECVAGAACIGGHLHPSVAMDDGATSLRAPCFWFREGMLVLPAFGRFTGTRNIRVRGGAGERVFVVGEGEVIEARMSRAVDRAARA